MKRKNSESIAHENTIRAMHIPATCFGKPGNDVRARKSVFVALAGYADAHDIAVYPSDAAKLARECDLSVSALREALIWLERNGFIKIFSYFEPDGGAGLDVELYFSEQEREAAVRAKAKFDKYKESQQ